MKKVEDYLKYYINAARFRLRYVDYTSEQWSVWTILTPLRFKQCSEDVSVENIQLELRPLSSMTEEEAIEVAKLSEWEPHFTNPRVEKNKFDDLIVRWGAGRDQIESYNATGELFYCYEQFHYLLNKGFDLFQLIEEGLALAANPQSSVTNQTRV